MRVKLTHWVLRWGLSPSVRYVFAGNPAAERASQKVGRFITYELTGGRWWGGELLVK